MLLLIIIKLSICWCDSQIINMSIDEFLIGKKLFDYNLLYNLISLWYKHFIFHKWKIRRREGNLTCNISGNKASMSYSVWGRNMSNAKTQKQDSGGIIDMPWLSQAESRKTVALISWRPEVSNKPSSIQNLMNLTWPLRQRQLSLRSLFTKRLLNTKRKFPWWREREGQCSTSMSRKRLLIERRKGF